MNGRLSSYEIDQTERMQGFTTIGILLEKVSWLEEQHLERPIVNKKITTRSNDKGKMSR